MSGRVYWGPRLWYVFHVFSANIDLNKENRALWGHFLRSSIASMNCNVCQAHFSKAVGDLHIPSLSSREDLELWFWERHNEVNQRNQINVYAKTDLVVYKIRDAEQRKIIRVQLLEKINDLSINFLNNEHAQRTIPGTTKIWKSQAIRFLAQL